ncbi:ParB N-terminal domain-containing protein [bacterium]|nr:ParB N-terminal domain-containing protein [bacterium]
MQEQELKLETIGEAYGKLRLVNPRAEKQMLASLCRYGQMSPVVVCRAPDEGYELLDGFKRLRATRCIGTQQTLTARVLEIGARAAKAAVLQLNWASQSVSDLEEGWVVHALCREDGLTQAEVGELVGRGHSWVSRRLSLVERLCDEVQSQLRLGLITKTVGRELARVPRGTQEPVLETIITHGLGSRQVAQLVALYLESSRQEQAQLLEAPREVLAEQGKSPAPARDARLSKAGNRLLRELYGMERSCSQVQSAVGLSGISQLRTSDLQVLAPAVGQAQRAGQQACEALAAVLQTQTPRSE